MSANVDGPSVIPKQIPKKIPKTIQHATTPPPPQATATPIPVAITPLQVVVQPETLVPTIVEQIDDNICVEMHPDGQYIENEAPIQVPITEETPPIETRINEVTEELEQMSVTETVTEFVTNNINENQSEEVEEASSQIDEALTDEPEEVITEFDDETESSSLIITEKSVVDNDKLKQETSTQQQTKLLGPIDETDRVLPAISHRPEHVRSEFERVMEKYGGQFANTAVFSPGLVSKDPAVVDNNGTMVASATVATGSATDLTVMDPQKQQEKQEGESEDDDADKENNIQNKKYFQEVSSTAFY